MLLWNIGTQMSVWVLASNSFGYVTRSRIAGSYGDSMFNFLRNAFILKILFLEPALEKTEVQKEELQEPEVDVVSLGFPWDKYFSSTTAESD